MSAHFVLNKSKLREQYARLRENGWVVSYSVKTNPEVARVLHDETDCLFSVHSLEELAHVRDASRAWFLAQWLTGELVREVFGRGVSRMVVENESDLVVILEFLRENPSESVELMLRMKLRENTIFTGKYYVFGMESAVVERLVGELSRHPQVRALGIHVHRQTQNVSVWDVVAELRDLLL